MSGAPVPGIPQPTTASGRAGLRALLDEPARALLGFDFDGTLAPIVADPASARPHPGALAALARLGAHVGRLAVVTGRPADTAVEYGGFAGVPGLDDLIVLGHYGRERWDASTNRTIAAPPHPGVDQVRRELPGVLARADAPEGTAIEDKGEALAVHTRRADDPESAFALLRGPLSELAARAGLALEPGRLVLELRPPGVDKGAALRGLVAELGPSVVAFAGDDLGDLAAFAAVERLRTGGTPGLLICSGSAEVPTLRERADLVVDGPAGVVALLEALADALSSPAA